MIALGCALVLAGAYLGSYLLVTAPRRQRYRHPDGRVERRIGFSTYTLSLKILYCVYWPLGQMEEPITGYEYRDMMYCGYP